jgi:hypothetical protein
VVEEQPVAAVVAPPVGLPTGEGGDADLPAGSGGVALTLEQQAEIMRLLAAGKAVTIGPDGSVSAADAKLDEAVSDVPDVAATPPSVEPVEQVGVVEGAAESSGDTVLVPAGYRSTARLRPHEAAAVLDSYERGEDVPIRYDGKVVGWARYYDGASPEARKQRANVLVERAQPNGGRRVCWVRQHEAKAVLRAADLKRISPSRTAGAATWAWSDTSRSRGPRPR